MTAEQARAILEPLTFGPWNRQVSLWLDLILAMEESDDA